MDAQEQYENASLLTGSELRTIAHKPEIRDLSSLSLPEIDAAVDLIARIAPAGNVPGVILNGMLRLSERKLPLPMVRRDIGLLFRGVEQAIKDRAVYGAFFAGPAAIIWAYQKLLQLAGKDPEASFPEGTWQFYVDYALRDDTARHANETHGFDTRLRQHGVQLTPVDRLTAWVMTAVYTLHQYPSLLENEWRERVYITILQDITAPTPDAARFTNLYRAWEKQRPYQRGHDANPHDDYPTYRRRQFDQFLIAAMRDLPDSILQAWKQRVQTAVAHDLPAYQRQMSILAYLDPGAYAEARTPIPLVQAHVGLIYQGRYYLLPACAPNGEQPAHWQTTRAQIATILAHPAATPPAQLQLLARTRRTAAAAVRASLEPTLQQELAQLRLSPIWINADPRPRHLPLASLRQVERGAGDHPLTLFRTDDTFVFDQSHIFFDGAWGAALAEIMTNEALSWAAYLRTLPPPQPGQTRPFAPTLSISAADRERILAAPRVASEVCVETRAIKFTAIAGLRRKFKQRSDLLQLTVNDLLVLYRAIHAATYAPPPSLTQRLQQLAQAQETAIPARTAQLALQSSPNPAILIPVDVSKRRPSDRIFPMTFSVPLVNFDLLAMHRRVLEALEQSETERGRRKRRLARESFEQLQRDYLGTLAGFGEMMSRVKEVAGAGESASVGAIKLLAHLPRPLQHILDHIPNRFDVLNDIIRGREVFSNVGAVVPTSTLSRFITAKDDNDKKTLAWGVMTDATGIMTMTLRDFRPHVAQLEAVGELDTAILIAQDYLDSYAYGFNQFARDLDRIVSKSGARYQE